MTPKFVPTSCGSAGAGVPAKDTLRINRRRKHFEGKIQEHYGYAEDRVRNDVDDWLNTF